MPLTLQEESITLASRIGARIVVLHPERVGADREKAYSSMVKNLHTLASIAEDYGVTLGLENKEGTDPSNCSNPERACCYLHLHDNRSQWTEKYDGDEHMAPGKGCTDFSVLKLLTGYGGVYNLEVFSVDDICSGKETIDNSLKI